MTTAEITVTVETPAFVAAAGAEAPAELRMPSLRGTARYWFRMLAAPVFADDPAAVAAAEAEVFGAASGLAGPDRRRGPSRLVLRPLRPVPAVRDPQPSWLRGGAGPVNGIGYLLGPGIYQPPGHGGHPGLLRPHYLPPSQQVEGSPKGTFLVRVVDNGSEVSADYVAEMAGISLWAVATFGGIGARVHRGFGGLRFAGLDRLSPALAAAGAVPPDHAPRSSGACTSSSLAGGNDHHRSRVRRSGRATRGTHGRPPPPGRGGTPNCRRSAVPGWTGSARPGWSCAGSGLRSTGMPLRSP